MQSNKKFIKDDNGRITKVLSVYHKPSKTNPDFAKEADINNIIDRFTKTGQLTHVAKTPMVYADQTQLPQDLQSAIHYVKYAEKTFNKLNKKLQNRFQNPEQLAQYLEDPKNLEEAETLGIIQKRDKPDDAKKIEPKPAPPQDPPPKEPNATKAT